MRIRLYLLCLVLFCTSSNISAQPNLVATWASIITPTINHCQNFQTSFTIKNIGTATAGSSIAHLYIADNISFTNAHRLSGSSVKLLVSGDSTNLSYTFSIPSTLVSGSYYVGVLIDATNVVPESDESNFFYITAPFTITSATSYSTKIPYPIIFIHGLNGSDQTWDDFTDKLDSVYGFQFGGRMNFCLNSDNNQYTSNFLADYTDFTAISSTLQVGDYYYVNFAVNNLGVYNPSSCMNSNQSAIFKQGRAVRDAIKHVMQITGRDKVILVGHSMGGLASREYLENSGIWQPDGKHHVAKLFTIGTPHGGSNLTGSVFASIFLGINELSEAVRDLRYPSLAYSGRFLFGGTESSFGSLYYSDDINCNGYVGDAITGLNQKPLPSNISYACTIGTGVTHFGLSGVTYDDGVVDADKADLNNYYTVHIADTFIDNQYALVQSHMDLNKNFEINMKGLDEDNYYNNDYPYQIGLNYSYFGFIQKQSATGFLRDYDDYAFKCAQKGTLKIKIENIIAPDFKLWLVDSSNPTVALSTFPISSNQNGNIDVQIQLPVGKYILETDAAPVANGYYFPYLIKTNFANNWSTPIYTICSGATQLLTAPAGFSTYQWALNGVPISGATTQSYVAATAGYYSFKTTNNYGYIGPWSDSVQVIVNSPPNAGTIVGSSSVCVGASITLSDAAPGGSWTALNGNATVSGGGLVTGVSAGLNTISYSVTNSCGTSVATKNININPLPNAGTIAGPSVVCVGAQITLTRTVSGGTWSAANSTANVSSSGVVTGISAGTNTISYSISNSCGTSAATKSININPLPNAGTIVGVSSVCVGASITLSDATPGGTWTALNGNSTVSSSGVVTGISTGTNIISYSVSNSCSTVPAVATKSITINPLPFAGTITGSTEVCVGGTISLSSDVIGGTWSCTDAVATVSDGNVSGVSVGSGIISYSVSNVCATMSAIQLINVNPLPEVPGIAMNGNILSTTEGYDSYQWSLDGSPITNANTSKYKALVVGTYAVTVSNSYNCSTSSEIFIVSEFQCDVKDLKIYPNPSESIVYVDWCKKVTIKLTSMDGRLLKSIENVYEIDLGNIPNGSYQITLFDEKNTKLKTELITKIN